LNRQKTPLHLNAHIKSASVYQAGCRVVRALHDAGFEAYIVGGFVRSALLLGEHFVPSDLDIATSAGPDAIRSIFRKVSFVGKSFGVTLVHTPDHDIEVATLRTEGPYSDGRRPDYVQPGTLYEDSCRRDFTINALYFDPEAEQVLDFHGGIADAANRILQTVGDPRARFREDLLRVMRLCRFAAENDLTIDPVTWQAACDQALHLTGLARERVIGEIQKASLVGFGSFCSYLDALKLPLVLWRLPDLSSRVFTELQGCNKEFPLTSVLLAFLGRLARESAQAQIVDCAHHVLHWPTTVEDRRSVSALFSLVRWLRGANVSSTTGGLSGPPVVGSEREVCVLILAAFALLRKFAPIRLCVLKAAIESAFLYSMKAEFGASAGAGVSCSTESQPQIWAALLAAAVGFLNSHGNGGIETATVGDLMRIIQSMGSRGLDRQGMIKRVHQQGVPSASQVVLDLLAVTILFEQAGSTFTARGQSLVKICRDALDDAVQGTMDLVSLASAVQAHGSAPFK
jgi:hypothetical protein